MSTLDHAVAEMQGLYGPFTMHERIVQKIWLQQDFDTSRAALLDGSALEIISPGQWNLLGGPDFFGARLRIGGREIVGDVEIHFHAVDWASHGHASNPSYANVALHVVLFPPDFPECAARRWDGTPLPTLVLLPLLHRDLEEYAADAALETLTARDDWRRFAELANRTTPEVEELLRSRAQDRWRAKVAYMRTRIERLGWEEAAHHTALEILGYRRNRVPMLLAATRWPLATWRQAPMARAVFDALLDRWNRHGVRPANQPYTRLQQYERLVACRPDWPDRLQQWGKNPGCGGEQENGASAAFRKGLALNGLAGKLAEEVTGNAIGGTRFDTLVCDGFLPLVTAQTGTDLGKLWHHWWIGDLPDSLRRALGRLEVAGVPGKPFSQGLGQGLLAWLMDQER